MPRATKTAAAAGSPERDPGEPRRSSRIKQNEKDKPAPPPPKKKAAKPRAKKADGDASEAKTTKKRTAADKEADAEEAGEAKDDAEEPAPKKAKAGSEKPASKPASKASRAGSTKPASKAAAKDDAKKADEGPDTIPEEEDDAGEEIKALEIGDVLPDITLKTEKNEDISIKSLAEETGVVLFLFPKADTPGCTKQACGFRDIYKEFTDVGYTVYGLSGDAPTATTKWQTKNELPYSFLSDPKKELIKALGAVSGKSTKRSHFVFEKGGKLLDKKIPVKPEESPTKALEFIKSLKA
ncbi:AhpC-TSA-domain-containing protein [Exidia glandulosa HHB12029]|uniref:thioredoxin-dependent peroxiredoxin n=1 Tax=Exidia glandulosa HHB12029 TaxID=1314781 RepID=A0A165IW82_EXIGL|nr:AhpC-TSA-domain-containing protein [Exidia glandulosa HHB12029]